MPQSLFCTLVDLWECVSSGRVHDHLPGRDRGRCKAEVEVARRQFRSSWGALHPLSTARRWETLATLQPMAEVQVCRSHFTLGYLQRSMPPRLSQQRRVAPQVQPSLILTLQQGACHWGLQKKCGV